MSKMKKMRLYKYVSISNHSLGIIATGKIWYSKPKHFNDPFDCGLDLFDDMTIEEKIQVLRVQMEREDWAEKKITERLQHSFTPNGDLHDTAANIIKKLSDAIHKNRDNVGILSLSRTCRSVLMWSHYAADHRGICIEFTVPTSNSLHKVNYSSNVPRHTLHDFFVKRNSKTLSLFITKHKHWFYEKEYRVILDRGNILHNIPSPITSIIIGLRTPSDDELLIRKIASGMDDIRFKRCIRMKDKFSVKIEDA